MSVELETHRGVLVVRLARPERRNALDGPTMQGLGTALTEAEADDSIRVIVLTGTGDAAFCAGMDLRAFAEDPSSVQTARPGLEVLMSRCYPKPVIAAVNGSAVGGGFDLMLSCDLVVAADHATFALPEVQRGLVTVGGSTRLSTRVPPAQVYEMCLTGDPMDAVTAHRFGLVNAVVPAEQLMEHTMALAERIAAQAPLAVRTMKAIIYDRIGLPDEGGWKALREQAAVVFSSEDAREGARAFAERRAPEWKGR